MKTFYSKNFNPILALVLLLGLNGGFVQAQKVGELRGDECKSRTDSSQDDLVLLGITEFRGRGSAKLYPLVNGNVMVTSGSGDAYMVDSSGKSKKMKFSRPLRLVTPLSDGGAAVRLDERSGFYMIRPDGTYREIIGPNRVDSLAALPNGGVVAMTGNYLEICRSDGTVKARSKVEKKEGFLDKNSLHPFNGNVMVSAASNTYMMDTNGKLRKMAFSRPLRSVTPLSNGGAAVKLDERPGFYMIRPDGNYRGTKLKVDSLAALPNGEVAAITGDYFEVYGSDGTVKARSKVEKKGAFLDKLFGKIDLHPLNGNIMVSAASSTYMMDTNGKLRKMAFSEPLRSVTPLSNGGAAVKLDERPGFYMIRPDGNYREIIEPNRVSLTALPNGGVVV